MDDEDFFSLVARLDRIVNKLTDQEEQVRQILFKLKDLERDMGELRYDTKRILGQTSGL